ncbi:hypothetical protein TH63_03630 [Rufibacter radiotolerans]|uniref:Lipoprotein n=1 Tax=Rufibacter radiotolerans TaxID=1379910 RepID=A0A0H4VH05_9BACT|nr:hypothetical protein [Rufibacter radiotolerans]AKQ44920.1 hypothetical protein TH63_03630 [Rufibacter radiotolerans]
MKPYLLYLACLLLASCTLSKNIVTVPYRADEKFLTPQEMQQLKTTGQVSKAFSATSPTDTITGTIKIITDGDDYKYIEVGDWVEVLTYHPQVWITGKTRAVTSFDSLGNFVRRKVYEKPNKQSGYYLREEWSSSQVKDGNQVQHLENVWVYDQNGEKTFEQFWVQDFDTPASWRQKKKTHINTLQYYNAQGRLKKEKFFNAEGKFMETIKH